MSFLAAYQQRHGVSPTLEEIGNDLGVTRVTVFQHVRSLEEKGAVRREPLLARSLEILDPEFRPESNVPGIPILGRIAAGQPIEAVEDPPTLDVTDLIPTGADLYALRVQGQSMIEDGIHDGDYVIVESRNTARNGETVVAILPGEAGDEATLKRYYRESDHVRLEPANPTMEAIRVREVEIRGVVRGVIRTY